MHTYHVALFIMHLMLQSVFIYFGVSAYRRAKWWKVQPPLIGWNNREHAQHNYRQMWQVAAFGAFNFFAVAYNGYLAFA